MLNVSNLHQQKLGNFFNVFDEAVEHGKHHGVVVEGVVPRARVDQTLEIGVKMLIIAIAFFAACDRGSQPNSSPVSILLWVRIQSNLH